MRRSVLPALSLTLALTACGFSDASDGDGDATGPTSGTTAASETDGIEVELNERGNVPMEVGQEAAVRPSSGPDEPPSLTLTLEEVVVDAVCDDDSEVPPENGHYIAILLRATATEDFDARLVNPIADYDFTVIGEDGDTYPPVSEASRTCFGPPRQIQNMRIGPEYEYVGWMVLDVPVTSGTLVYEPGQVPYGWEWQF